MTLHRQWEEQNLQERERRAKLSSKELLLEAVGFIWDDWGDYYDSTLGSYNRYAAYPHIYVAPNRAKAKVFGIEHRNLGGDRTQMLQDIANSDISLNPYEADRIRAFVEQAEDVSINESNSGHFGPTLRLCWPDIPWTDEDQQGYLARVLHEVEYDQLPLGTLASVAAVLDRRGTTRRQP